MQGAHEAAAVVGEDFSHEIHVPRSWCLGHTTEEEPRSRGEAYLVPTCGPKVVPNHLSQTVFPLHTHLAFTFGSSTKCIESIQHSKASGPCSKDLRLALKRRQQERRTKARVGHCAASAAGANTLGSILLGASWSPHEVCFTEAYLSLPKVNVQKGCKYQHHSVRSWTIPSICTYEPLS